MTERKFDPRHVASLDSEARKLVLPVQAIIAELDRLDLPEKAVLADVGCGTGYLTIPLAQKVGKDVTVIAADVEPAMLSVLKERASGLGGCPITGIVAREVEDGPKYSRI